MLVALYILSFPFVFFSILSVLFVLGFIFISCTLPSYFHTCITGKESRERDKFDKREIFVADILLLGGEEIWKNVVEKSTKNLIEWKGNKRKKRRRVGV